MMRSAKWWLAGAALLVGGAALADSRDCKDTHSTAADASHKNESDVERCAHKAGKDVRTGYEESKSDVKASANEAKQDVQAGAENAANKAAEGTEKTGVSVGQATREGAAAVSGQPSKLQFGELRNGNDIHNTLTTDPIGIVTGGGLNLEYAHSLANKWDVRADGQLARANITGGSVTQVGLIGGVDYYLLGRHNEGLRVGPRLQFGVGTDTAANTNSTAFGVAGEAAYDWVASNGITAGLAGGLRGRVASTHDTAVNDTTGNSSFGPYAKLNIGYSW